MTDIDDRNHNNESGSDYGVIGVEADSTNNTVMIGTSYHMILRSRG